MTHHNGWHRTHPQRWELIAWITLQALAVALTVGGVMVGVYALSVLAGGSW